MSDIAAIATRYAEDVWNRGDLSATEVLFTADHVYHDPLMPDLPRGPEGVRARVQAYMGGFPDARVDVTDIVSSGDVVAARWVWGGTNTGPLLGGPSTGKAARIEGMHWFRFEGDRIAETWTQADNVGLLTQVGVLDLGAAQTA